MSEEEIALYELAFSLGIPVYKLLREMPYTEFMDWFLYFKARPQGWRDDLRSVYSMKASGAKIDAFSLFPSLASVLSKKTSDNPMDSLKGSKMHGMLAGAVGGDKLEW